MKRLFFIILVFILMLLGFSGCSLLEEQDKGPIKVGLLLTSSPDSSYSEGYYGYLALKFLENKYDVEIAYNENVSTEDASYWLNNYGTKEYDLVIGLGGVFNDPMIEVSGSYSDTSFVCIGGSKSENNVTSYILADEDVNHLAGFIAGFLTEGSDLGYISYSGMDLYVDSFTAGAREVNSAFLVEKYIMESSSNYLDIVSSLVSKGDVATGVFVNSSDLEKTLFDSGVMFVSVGGIRSSVEGASLVPRIAYNYDGIFDRVFIDYRTDNLKGENISIGFGGGYIYMDSYDGLSDEIIVKVDNLIKTFK